MVLVLGGLMVVVGLAFKLSAVPFHFWCPDVFEGASAEVNAFLVGRLEGRGPGAVGARGDRLRHHAGTAPQSPQPRRPRESRRRMLVERPIEAPPRHDASQRTARRG